MKFTSCQKSGFYRQNDFILGSLTAYVTQKIFLFHFLFKNENFFQSKGFIIGGLVLVC